MPYRSPRSERHFSPLLPFERELINLLGLSEEEYRHFEDEVRRRGTVRPAEYDHIPDIRCDPATIAIISLVVGVASTAASLLLAPKPKQVVPSAQKRGGESRQLRDITGNSRFDQSAGFSGSAQLAEYGTLISILFGAATATTGGLIAKPSLVWSRMFSFGRSQGYKGCYVVGEGLLDHPSIEGVFLGANPLSPVLSDYYSAFWTRRDGSNRIQMSDQFAGTLEPEPLMSVTDGEFALCPTLLGGKEPGFSEVANVTNNAEFGAYAPLLNGNAVKFNYRTISSPVGAQSNGRAIAERYKIGGEYGQNDGMPGDGRGYSPLMALCKFNDVEYQNPTFVYPVVGDTIGYRITGTSYQYDSNEVTLEDLNDRLRRMREEADDALQLGELFLIDRSIWKVTYRPDRQWRIEEGTFDYTLTCIELLPNHVRIELGGVANTYPNYPYEGDYYRDFWMGTAHSVLQRYAFASYRNSRAVEAVEFGLQANVYQRSNGLTNFKEVPSVDALINFDRQNISISNGSMQTYLPRASCFNVLIRPVGTKADGSEYEWASMTKPLVVIGNTPQIQYNFLRIKYTEQRQMEFRIVPRPGADVRHNATPESLFIQLNSNSGELLGVDADTAYGRFKLVTVGTLISWKDFQQLDEMHSGFHEATPGYYKGVANGMELEELLPTAIPRGKGYEYVSHYLGRAIDHQNQTRSAEYTIDIGSGKSMRVRLTARSQYTTEIDYPPASNWFWFDYQFDVLSATGSWAIGDRVEDTVAAPYLWKEVTAVFRVDSVETVWIPPAEAYYDRVFEYSSQLADVSHFTELEKSNADNSEFTISYVNESFTEPHSPPNFDDIAMFGLSLRAAKGFSQIEQVNVWLANGVPVKRMGDKYNGSVGPSNRFSDLVYYLLTDDRVGLGQVVSPAMIDESGFHRTSNFLEHYDLCWDGVIGNKINIREFCTTNAPVSLCSFVVRNGRFSLEPALPTNDNGELVTGAVPVAQIFTAGNIIDGSFALEYLEAQDRENFTAVVKYRKGLKHELPKEQSFKVVWADATQEAPEQQTFDLSQFCTSSDQAFMMARFMMSVERRIDHTITFKTTPQQANVAPGAFIKVITESSPYQSFQNAVVLDDGRVVSLSGIQDGTYDVDVYRRGSEQVESVQLQINDGLVADPAFRGSIFSVKDVSYGTSIYQVEQITFDEDGLIEIKASIHPTDENGASLITRDVLTESNFLVES